MRTLPLRGILSRKGVSFEERHGVEVPSAAADLKTEYHKVRDAVGITDFSSMQKFRFSGEGRVDFLDALFPGNVAKIRFCRVLHTFLADESGFLMADCYVANNDEDCIVLCESIVDDAAIKKIFNAPGAQEAGMEDRTDTHVAVSIDGFKAWAVVKELFGADVLGLPYLSIETYSFEGTPISLFRAGKTSEFGYILLAPREIGPKLLERLIESAEKNGGGLCGTKVHDTLRLEGRFFNIYAEGALVKDPLPLGLQWMIDFDKDTFLGQAAITQRRKNGVAHKIIGIRVDCPAPGLRIGDAVYMEGKKAAEVESACFSYALGSWVGLALFPAHIAYAGLRGTLGKPDGPAVETISMPPIIPKSLTVKLDEL